MTALIVVSLGALALIHVLERIRRRPLTMSTAWVNRQAGEADNDRR